MPVHPFPAGEPIARGNTSDVWPWTAQTVVKILRPETPTEWAAIEADIVARVHAAGLPVPDTDGVVDVGGRTGIILERIDGESMWERMKHRPEDIATHVDTLVDLQVELHRTRVAGLPDIAQRLSGKIDEATSVPAGDRQLAKTLIARLPGGAGPCHGDFHPANIVLADRGPVILDWYDGGHGSPVADFARSSLLMRPPVDNAWLPGGTRALLDEVHATYVSRLARRRLVTAEEFGPWEAAIAVARMSEPVPPGDLLATWAMWRSKGVAASASLIERCLAQVAAKEDRA